MDQPTPAVFDTPRGVTAAQVRWTLMVDGQDAGRLHPEVGAQMSNDPTQAVPRTVRGVRLTPTEYADVNVFSDRVRVDWVEGGVWPLGIFGFVDPVEEVRTTGDTVELSLADQWLDLGQPVTHSVSVPPGGYFTDTMRTLVVEVGLDPGRLEPSGAKAGDPVNWQIGTNRGQIIRDLASLAGHMPPYFDNRGVFVSRAPDWLAESWGHNYTLTGPHARIAAGSIRRPRKSVDAAGVHVVLDTGSTLGPVYGIAEVDSESPLHPARRRSTRVEVHQMQGVGSTQQATRIARSKAAQALDDYDTVEFAALPDPRHDTWDVVTFDGVNFREQSWTLALRAGGLHTHRLARSAA